MTVVQPNGDDGYHITWCEDKPSRRSDLIILGLFGLAIFGLLVMLFK